jgi:2,3-bisphosphoglycerate-independent phosphoglycerate mutase
MYKGLAKLVGMQILGNTNTIGDKFIALRENYDDYDFFFLHVKETDSAGEDGDFDRKLKIIEEIDRRLTILINLQPDVLLITADHSTPSVFMKHSWHPVPTILYSKWCRPDSVSKFSETACLLGGLGHVPATELMSLVMANALRLTKLSA